MALVPQIRSVLSGIGAKFADGVIEYRTLTSAPNAKPRTYSAWVVLPLSRVIEQRDIQVRDPDTGIWYREETCQLRVPYQVAVILTLADQVRNSAAVAGPSVDTPVWSIREKVDAADGSVRAYNLFRQTPLMQNARPGGGV